MPFVEGAAEVEAGEEAEDEEGDEAEAEEGMSLSAERQEEEVEVTGEEEGVVLVREAAVAVEETMTSNLSGMFLMEIHGRCLTLLQTMPQDLLCLKTLQERKKWTSSSSTLPCKS